MIFLKPSSACIAVVFGLVGGILCLVGIWYTWSVRPHLIEQTNRVHAKINEALTLVEMRVEETGDVVKNARQATGQFDAKIKLAIQNLLLRKTAEVVGLDEVEQRIAVRLQEAKDWIDLAVAAAELIEQLLDVVDSVSPDFESEHVTASQLTAQLQAIQNNVVESFESLKEVEERLAEIRLEKKVAENAGESSRLVTLIDSKLEKAEEKVRQFQEKLALLQKKLAASKARTLAFINKLAILATFLCLWIAVAQASLLLHGWNYLKRQRNLTQKN